MVAEDVDTTTLNTIVVDVRHRVEMDGGVDDTSQAEADELTYRFTAKIDFKGLIPTQRVEEEGLISLK